MVLIIGREDWTQMANLLLFGLDHWHIFGCDDWPQMVKLLLFGFDNWLIFGCDDGLQVAKCLFWDSREWNNTASARVEFRNPRHQWAMSTCQFQVRVFVLVTLYHVASSTPASTCCLCFGGLTWQKEVCNHFGVQSLVITISISKRNKVIIREQNLKRSLFFYFFVCSLQKFLLTHMLPWSSWLSRWTGPKAFRLGPKWQLLSPKTLQSV